MAKLSVRNRNKGKFDKNGNRKPANWEYRFDAAKVDGKRRQVSKSGFASEKEAYNAGLAALNEYNSGGQIVKPSDMSLSDYLDIWLEKHIRVNMRGNTYDAYETHCRVHIKPMIGHYRLNALSPAALQDFANDVKKKPLSRNYRVNIIKTLKNALDYAVSPLQYIKYNYAAHIIMPRMSQDRSTRMVFSTAEWEKISRRFPFGNKYHIPLLIGYHSGARISEILGLTWDDIDFEAGTITINKQIMNYQRYNKDSNFWCFAPPKSDSGIRVMRVGSTLLTELRKERNRQKTNRLMYGEYWKTYGKKHYEDDLYQIIEDGSGVDFVCRLEDGAHMTNTRFQYCPRIIKNELGIEFNFHSLRHTHATILAENGVNPKNLQARLGHALVETTLQNYVHNTEKMEDEAVSTFERVIKKG